MYNKHFHFIKSPFRLTPDIHFFCQLKPYEDALQTVLISLEHEEGFLKITGPVGTGKTMLCRRLLSQLEGRFATAYLSNPALPVVDLYKHIIYELEGKLLDPSDQLSVYQALNHILLEHKKQNKRVVLIVDEAQALSDEGLEAIRLLTNLETETSKLLQVVLFGQPELDVRLNQPKFLQIKQRIVFSYQLHPLNKEQFLDYIKHRVIKAGYSYQQLFNENALNKIFKASGGIPRLINILCHKALIASYGKNESSVSMKSVDIAIADTFEKSAYSIFSKFKTTSIAEAVLLTLLFVVLIVETSLYWPRFL